MSLVARRLRSLCSIGYAAHHVERSTRRVCLCSLLGRVWPLIQKVLGGVLPKWGCQTTPAVAGMRAPPQGGALRLRDHMSKVFAVVTLTAVRSEALRVRCGTRPFVAHAGM